ncbi:MAG: GNAT family N-acetyltransferase [Devosia sp.]
MVFAVRRILAGDEKAFASIAPDVFDEPVDPARLHRYLRQSSHMIVLAFEGELVIGQCAAAMHYHPDKPVELYIDEVGTASTHRRQGVARAMLDEMFRWGREQGCEEAWLGTELDNVEANGLYRGYRPIEDEAIQYYLFTL